MISHTIQHDNKTFQLKQLIYSGGVGGVYSAVEKETQQQVAIKVFVLTNTMSKVHFENEVSIIRRLSGKPHFPVLVGAFKQNNKAYLITEKLPIDLFTLLQHQLSEKVVRNIFYQLCDAVRTCHKHKIAHLDIKPENILLDAKGTVVLCDFGHSVKFRKGTPVVLEPLGTPIYRAPEVNRQELLQPIFADVWSLGIVLHLMTTSKLPYKASTSTEMEQKLNNENLCFSALQNSPFSRELKHLIWCMLQVNPLKRITLDRVFLHPWFRKAPV